MATSLKDYLKKYQSTGDEDKQPKKSKKKRKVAAKVPGGLIIVDNDAAWQKNIDEDSDAPEGEGDDGPQVIEDVEVKRMHQMERAKQHRPYMSIGDDGSGWSTEDRKSKQTSDPLRAGSPGASPSRSSDPPSSSQGIPDVFPLRRTTPDAFPSGRIPPEETSPPRKRNPPTDSLDLSPPRRESSRADPTDTSRPMKMTDGRQAGLITNKELAVELLEKKQQERLRDMEGGRQAGLLTNKELAAEPLKQQQQQERSRDMENGGRAVETIYRDRRGKRLEELLRQQQGEVKPLEWGTGLVQKRELEKQHAEFEAEKLKPFARSRDDPELDKMYKERVRWGDPMARLLKRKDPAPEVGFKVTEEMKESGFIIPQCFPQRSWLERGVAAPVNRYGIKPGRHWDGEDRSTGFERQMSKAKAENLLSEM